MRHKGRFPALVLAGACLSVPLLVLLAAVMGGQDGHAIDLDAVLHAMSTAHLLGTDALGRDVLARLAEGLQLSLMVGVVVVLCGGMVGISIGMLAGWAGGWLDATLMRFADIVLSFPGILLAIALAAMLGPGVDNLVMALVAVGWVGFARLARAQVLSLKSVPFVEAAIANGSGVPYIAIRHLLPNIAAPLLIEASFGLAAVIIGEAGLSFLGVGVQPPTPSWGNIIFENQTYFQAAPWLVFIPGAAIILLALAFNLVGDALRDELDPTQRGRG